MKKLLIAVVCTGTLCAFNPESPDHLHARRLLGERKMTKEQFFEAIKQLNKADYTKQIRNTIRQKSLRTVIEKS